MDQVPTEQEWAEWQGSICSKAFRELLAQRREELKEAWANGAMTVTDDFTTVIANTRSQAQAEELAAILELDYNTFLGEIDDGKHASTEPVGPEAKGPCDSGE